MKRKTERERFEAEIVRYCHKYGLDSPDFTNTRFGNYRSDYVRWAEAGWIAAKRDERRKR